MITDGYLLVPGLCCVIHINYLILRFYYPNLQQRKLSLGGVKGGPQDFSLDTWWS